MDLDTSLMLALQKKTEAASLALKCKPAAILVEEETQLEDEEEALEEEIEEDEEVLEEVREEEAEAITSHLASLIDDKTISTLAAELGYSTEERPVDTSSSSFDTLALRFALDLNGSPDFSNIFREWVGSRARQQRDNKPSLPGNADGAGRNNGDGSGRMGRPAGTTLYGTLSMTPTMMSNIGSDHFEMDDDIAMSLAQVLNVPGKDLAGTGSWIKTKWNEFRGKTSKKESTESYMGEEAKEYKRLTNMANASDTTSSSPMLGCHDSDGDDYEKEYQKLIQIGRDQERSLWFDERSGRTALDKETANTDGIFSTAKRWLHLTTTRSLVPVTAADSIVPRVLRDADSLVEWLENLDRTDELKLHVDNNTKQRSSTSLQKIIGVDNAIVYDVSRMGFYRSNLFKNKNGRVEPVVLEITYSSPLTHKRTSADLLASTKHTHALRKSQLWITASSIDGVHVLLRFERENGNPLLEHVILLTKQTIENIAADSAALSESEKALSEFILAGKSINIEAFADAHVIQEAESARIAMSIASSHLRFAFPSVSLMDNNVKPDYAATDLHLTDVLKNYSHQLNQVAEKNTQEPRVATAQMRGIALANHLQQALKGATDAKIRSVLQSIASTTGVFIMRDINSPALSVAHRINKFMGTNATLYASADALNDTFF